MKNRILQESDSYLSHLAGIKGGQLRSRQSEVTSDDGKYFRTRKKELSV
jgi:hypothetical protein